MSINISKFCHFKTLQNFDDYSPPPPEIKYSGTSVYVLNVFQIFGLIPNRTYTKRIFPIRNKGKMINPRVHRKIILSEGGTYNHVRTQPHCIKRQWDSVIIFGTYLPKPINLINLNSGGAVLLDPLGTAATNDLLCQTRVIMMMEILDGMIDWGNQSTRRKTVPVPLCPAQTPNAARKRTRVWLYEILWWTKVALGQIFSENFGFPRQSTFHLLLHNHLHYHPRLEQ
jgi:hypothetical protein